LGIIPEANSAYGIAEFEVYDPILPKSYFASFSAATGVPVRSYGTANFCPSIDSATLAREYGVSFIMNRQGAPAPAGTTLVAVIGNEAVYQVPGSGIVTLQPDSSFSPMETAVPVTEPKNDPASLHFTIDPKSSSKLEIHITNFPGWTASVDGHPLPLHTWEDTMMTANVGPGRHEVTLTYRPKAFDLGLLVSAVTAALLIAAMLIAWQRRRAATSRAWRALARSRDEAEPSVSLDDRQAELV
jgi:Bacterial membrane protein YfhO